MVTNMGKMNDLQIRLQSVLRMINTTRNELRKIIEWDESPEFDIPQQSNDGVNHVTINLSRRVIEYYNTIIFPNAIDVFDSIADASMDDENIIEPKSIDDITMSQLKNYADMILDDRREYCESDFTTELSMSESIALCALIQSNFLHGETPQQSNDVLPDYCNDCDAICLAQNINDRNNCVMIKINELQQPNNADQQIPDVKSGLVMTCVACDRTLKQSEMNGDVCMDCIMIDIDDSGVMDLSDDCLTKIMNRSGYNGTIIHHHIVDHEPLRHNDFIMQYKIICIFDELNENEYQLFGTVFVSMINQKWELRF